MSLTPPWTWDEEQSLIDGAIQGETIMGAARRLDRSRDSIEKKRKLLRREGRLPNFRGRPWEKDDRELIRLVKQGLKDSEIAMRLDRTATAIKVRRAILLDPQKAAVGGTHTIISEWRQLAGGVRMRTVEAAHEG